MSSRKTKVLKLLAHILVPAIFAVLGYLMLYLGLKPVWKLASAAAAVLASDSAPDFEPSLDNIYDPYHRDTPEQNAGVTVSETPAATPEPHGPYTLPPETPQPAETPGPTEDAPVQTHRPWIHHDGPISVADIRLPDVGTRYGHLYGFSIGLSAPVYYGDSNLILRYGVGQSTTSFMPGFGRIILISGHNTTFFKCLKNIAVGDEIIFDTNYETYTYRIYRVEVMESTALYHLLDRQLFGEQRENLVIYTCYPFHAVVGKKHLRLVAFGERIEGADVIWR